MGNEDLAPSQQCCLSLVLHPLPPLINNCLYLPPWNSGKVLETERLCAQESHQAFLGITMGETRCQYVTALQYLIRICVRDSSTRTQSTHGREAWGRWQGSKKALHRVLKNESVLAKQIKQRRAFFKNKRMLQRHEVEGNNIIHSGKNSFIRLNIGEHQVTDAYGA